MLNSFPKSARLRTSSDFRKVRKLGERVVGKYIIVYKLTDTDRKLGLSVPRQFGKAHIRNRFKRRMREIFRLSKGKPQHIEIKPRPYAKSAKYQELQAEFLKLTL